MIQDDQLNRMDKLRLIAGIERMQKVRWYRLRRWHNLFTIPRNLRHYFMAKEIELIRKQRKRLQRLKQSLLS